MTIDTHNAVEIKLGGAVISATGKLPDDLGSDEFRLIIDAVDNVVQGAIKIAVKGGSSDGEMNRERAKFDTHVWHVRYGSPLDVAIGIVQLAVPAAVTLALIFREYSRFDKTRAEADRTRAEGDKTRAEADKTRAETENLRAETARLEGGARRAPELDYTPRAEKIPMSNASPHERRVSLRSATGDSSPEVQRFTEGIREYFEDSLLGDPATNGRPKYDIAQEDYISDSQVLDLAQALAVLDTYDISLRIIDTSQGPTP